MSAVHPWHSATLPPGLHYILVWYSRSVHPEIWHTSYGVNACENHDPGNGKRCMMQMPVKTTLRLYCDDSHLISWVCEIILMYCDTVALLLSIVYYTAVIENYIIWMMQMPMKTTLLFTVMTVSLFQVCVKLSNVMRHSRLVVVDKLFIISPV